MSTGTLKLASLLVVIAAGGGVAWQAQQGILHPEQASAAADDDSDTDDPFEEVPTLATEHSPAESPRAIKLVSHNWEDDADDQPPPSRRPSSVPNKFQRSHGKSPSLGSPIPARTVAHTEDDELDSAKPADRGETTDDPFDNSEPPVAETPRRQPKLTPIPETDPADDDLPGRPAAAESQSEPASDATFDPFGESPPALRIGKDDVPKRGRPQAAKDESAEPPANDDEDPLTNAAPYRRLPATRRTKADDPAAEPTSEPEDDPFANAAPPERRRNMSKEAPADDSLENAAPAEDDPFEKSAPPDMDDAQPAKKSSKTPSPLEGDPDAGDDSKALPLFPSRRELEASDPDKSARTRGRAKPADEPVAEEQNNSESDPLAGAEPEAMPALKSPAKKPRDPQDDAEEEKATSLPDSLDPIPPRRRRTPKTDDNAPPEKSPRLLPVPEKTADDDAPELPPERKPARRSEPDNGFGDPPGMDEKAIDLRSSRNAIKTEELDGDGEPDRLAPKGLQQPRLTIEKVAPKQAVLGQPLIYSVIVKNAGSADAHQVTVEDRIPKGTKLEGTSPRAEMIDKRLVWRLGTLKPDEQKKISIKVIPQEQGPIGSVAKVNFVAEIAAEIEVTAPQVLLSVDAPSQVRLGDKLHLTFKVRNAGGADAQNIVLRNMIPDGLRHPAGNDLEYAIGTLPAQEAREIKLDLIATKNGKVANKTIITGDNGINLEEETPVEVVGEQLLLTRTGKNRLYVDKPALFTSTVTNEGTGAAVKVMVAEVVPAGLEFVSASDNGKFDPRTRAVTWSVGPIGPGEELKLSTKLMPKQLGDYRSTVTVTGPAGSVATVDAELKVDGFPAVAVASKSDSPLISVGEKGTIRVQCKNQGTAAAKNLVLSAELPPELKLVDGKGPTAWTQQGNVITFEAINGLDPNDTATFEFRVEGLTEGDTRIELQISADHLTRPLRRDETIRVAPEAE